MVPRCTIGIEEEFQLVDRDSGQLCPRIQTILEKGHAFFGELIKPEMLQSTVEINSAVLPDIPTARHEMRNMRATLASLVEEEGLALVSAGTHPTAMWQNELRSPYERYSQIEREFQDVARSLLIFGLHIHIGIESHELAVELMKSATHLAPPFARDLQQLPLLGWTPHRPQVVSLCRLETLPAQRGARSIPLLV